MRNLVALLAVAVFAVFLTSCGHDPAHSQRTLTVNASESVSVEPDLAILHIGFDTPPEDVKSAYADGARRSNAIVAALKQAGIPEADIRSESQYLYRVWSEEHKFKLEQQWGVKIPPQRAAEILDIAISAGANSSGQIEWTVKDDRALEDDALDRAAAHAKENATVLAKGMGVRLGALTSVSNQASAPQFNRLAFGGGAGAQQAAPPLAIEPHQVSRQATVSAIFEIE
ncbi:MAG TPA: SIMPL domain-containing protein [Terracidiphilus sp.]|jgi:hypothetical protein